MTGSVTINAGTEAFKLTAGATGLAADSTPAPTLIDILNILAQAGAVVTDVAADLNPVNPATIVAQFAGSAAAFATSLFKLKQDQANLKTISLGFVSDAVEVAGGLLGMFGATVVPLPTLRAVATNGGLFLTGTGLALNVLQIGSPLVPKLETGITNVIGALQTALSNSNATGTALFGNSWGTAETAISNALAAVSNLIVASNGTDVQAFLAAAGAISSIFSNANSSLFNLFGLGGNSFPTTTEMGSNSESAIMVKAGTFTGSGTVDSNTGDSSFTLPNASGSTILNPDGTQTFSLSTITEINSASETIETNGVSVLSQQFVLNGVTINAPLATTPQLNYGSGGTLLFNIGVPNLNDTITVNSTAYGFVEIAVAAGGTANAQPLISDFGSSEITIGTANNTLTISSDMSAGGTEEVQSDESLSNVTQDFAFNGPDSTLYLDQPESFSGTITNFLPTDAIDLRFLGTVTSATLEPGNMLSIATSGGSFGLQLDPSQSFLNVSFDTEGDGDGGTAIIPFESPVTSSSQTTTVAASDNNPQGQAYNATVAFSPSVIEFPTLRTDDLSNSTVTLTGTLIGGQLDPNDSEVIVEQLYPNPSAFYIEAGFAVNAATPTGTGIVGINSNDLISGPNDFSNEELPLSLSYDGGSTTVELNVGMKIYAPAEAAFFQSGSSVFEVDFGTIHIGQTVSQQVQIMNSASGNLVDTLSSNTGTLDQFTAENAVSNIAAGAEGTITVNMTGNTAERDEIDATPLFDLTGHDPDLPDESLASPLALVGSVNYYANPIFVDISPLYGDSTATFSENGNNWILNLGTIAFGSTVETDDAIEIENATPTFSYSDTLSGNITLSASADGGFVQSLSNISGQVVGGGGGFIGLGDIAPDSSALGMHSETITFNPVSSNDTGFSGALPAQTLTVVDDVVSTAVCFCRGTMIATGRGEIAVEELAVGDRVRTLSGTLRPIAWVGVGRDLVTRSNRLARPVIVRRGALAEGVPYRDLHLTHGHALYLRDVLIPVENLINHRSILWDEASRVIEYYHVELQNHDVVVANGAPAETYYDAGNRALFQNRRPGSVVGPAKLPFAPVLTGGAVVDAVWMELFRRAGGSIEDNTTDDPDLHLLVDGSRLDPASVQDGRDYIFEFARQPQTMVSLCSRTGVPSLLGIAVHDHRRLGVAVRQIVVRAPGIETRLDYDGRAFEDGGCYSAEAGYCWTDGEFELPARFFAHLTRGFTLTVCTEQPGMRYPIPNTAAKAA